MSIPIFRFFPREKNKMTSVEYIRDYCKKNGIAISKLESDLGYANGYFNPKKNKKIPIDKAVDIAEYLRIDVFDILDEEDTKKLLLINNSPANRVAVSDAGGDQIRIPVVRRVAAGTPLGSFDEVIGYETISKDLASKGSYFALKISGDSMSPNISNGDIIICREQPDAEDGQVVVALVNGCDGVCKRLRKYEDGTIALLSDNSSYRPLYFNNSEVDTVPVRVVGIVVELRRKF